MLPGSTRRSLEPLTWKALRIAPNLSPVAPFLGPDRVSRVPCFSGWGAATLGSDWSVRCSRCEGKGQEHGPGTDGRTPRPRHVGGHPDPTAPPRDGSLAGQQAAAFCLLQRGSRCLQLRLVPQRCFSPGATKTWSPGSLSKYRSGRSHGKTAPIHSCWWASKGRIIQSVSSGS